MAKALFLDRDGVINHDPGYLHRVADFRFLPGIFDLGRAAVARGFLPIVVTNQAGIGRGYYTEADYRLVTAHMLAGFAAAGIDIAAVYHCPYHPTAGQGRYRVTHDWRKPAPGMLLAAARDFALDLGASVLVGDRGSDIGAARAAGVGCAILIAHDAKAMNPESAGPDAVFDSVSAAAAWFADRFPRPAR